MKNVAFSWHLAMHAYCCIENMPFAIDWLHHSELLPYIYQMFTNLFNRIRKINLRRICINTVTHVANRAETNSDDREYSIVLVVFVNTNLVPSTRCNIMGYNFIIRIYDKTIA